MQIYSWRSGRDVYIRDSQRSPLRAPDSRLKGLGSLNRQDTRKTGVCLKRGLRRRVSRMRAPYTHAYRMPDGAVYLVASGIED